MKKSQFRLMWDYGKSHGQFKTGVSLHSHTMYSNESLGMVPRYTSRVPWLGAAIQRQGVVYEQRTGHVLDFGRAFWTPPLHPNSAYWLERKQIEKHFDAAAFVSLTDHDNIEAPALLNMIDTNNFHPISVEWTIPFGCTFYHLGIHNLPLSRAHEIMQGFNQFTADPKPHRLGGLLEELHRIPEVLIVLNHPLWDESGSGSAEHNRLLGRLLERHGQFFHALELNGLRSWQENAAVIRLAKEMEMPIISGGDRHGCEPNAIINLTNAATFAEFVSEIRNDGFSEVVFLPQYRDPIRLRVLQTMWDIVRDYSDQPHGRKHWNDRIFFRQYDGTVQPMSTIWQGKGPAVVKQFLWLLKLVENRRLRFALRHALDEREEFAFEP